MCKPSRGAERLGLDEDPFDDNCSTRFFCGFGILMFITWLISSCVILTKAYREKALVEKSIENIASARCNVVMTYRQLESEGSDERRTLYGVEVVPNTGLQANEAIQTGVVYLGVYDDGFEFEADQSLNSGLSLGEKVVCFGWIDVEIAKFGEASDRFGVDIDMLWLTKRGADEFQLSNRESDQSVSRDEFNNEVFQWKGWNVGSIFGLAYGALLATFVGGYALLILLLILYWTLLCIFGISCDCLPSRRSQQANVNSNNNAVPLRSVNESAFPEPTGDGDEDNLENKHNNNNNNQNNGNDISEAVMPRNGCPNRANPHHKCTGYCVERWGEPTKVSAISLPSSLPYWARSNKAVAMTVDSKSDNVVTSIDPAERRRVVETHIALRSGRKPPQEALFNKALRLIKKDQGERLRQMLADGGLSKNYANAYGNTLLLEASRLGKLDIVAMLVRDLNCDVSHTNAAGRDALWWARANGHADIVAFLSGDTAVVAKKKKKATDDSNDKLTFGNLLRFARDNQKQRLRAALQAGGKFHANYSDNEHFGNSLLIEASRYGHIGIVKMLVHEFHADVHRRNAADRDALWWARANGRKDCIEFLLQFPKPPSSSSASSSSSSSKARSTKQKSAKSQSPEKAEPKEMTIDRALKLAERSRVELLRAALTDKKIGVNDANEYGNTVLIQAARCGHLELVKMLVEEFDADATKCNSAGRNALWWAKANNKLDVVGYLYILMNP